MSFQRRAYTPADSHAVNALAVSAFTQYRHAYGDWGTFCKKIGTMAALSTAGDLIVAEAESGLVGTVAYLGSNHPEAALFNPVWSIMPVWVVSPSFRGGLSKTLSVSTAGSSRARPLEAKTGRLAKEVIP